jgi:hypothetical protein
MGPLLNPKSTRAYTAHSVKYIKRRCKSAAPKAANGPWGEP